MKKSISYLYNILLRRLQAVIFFSFFVLSAYAGEPEEVFVTLDWTVAETLIALGENPITMGDAKNYNRWNPVLPEPMQNLGIRLQPNPEQIAQPPLHLEPASLTFINSNFYRQATSQLKKHAKNVEVIDFYQEGDAWVNVINATKRIAELINKPDAFELLLNQYSHTINTIAPLVKPYLDRPIALVQFIDSRHLRIYAQNSPCGHVLGQLGFKNAWQGTHNYWGFETIEVTQLSQLPKNSRFVVIKPLPTNVALAIKYNVLWKKLDMARDPVILPALWTFGGIPSAQRFAEALANGLIHGGEG